MLRLRSFILDLLRRDTNISININAVAIRPGDDLVLSLPNRLDSDEAISVLDAVKEQFSGLRIHLLTGFGSVQVQRSDSGSGCKRGDDGAHPPLPVGGPARCNPFFEAAQASEKGDVVVITHATSSRLIAVYIPPKQQGDSIKELHLGTPKETANV